MIKLRRKRCKNAGNSHRRTYLAKLISFLGRMTRENLTCQIEYLKVETERRKLLKFGSPLGKDIKNIISIVRYETFQLWVRRYKRKKEPEKTKRRGRPKTLEEIRTLVVRLAKKNALIILLSLANGISYT